jgi:predicted ABC-type ATPase
MELYIIAGPNGVGKTTFAREFLPNYADFNNFVNADFIAQGMEPFSPETAAVRAGRMMLTEIQSFAKRRVPFAFETTLSGRSYMGLLQRLKAQGYKVHLFFLCVESVDVALSRVRGRFDRSVRNFLAYYRQLADVWTLFDNSGATPTVVAFEKKEGVRIIDNALYRALVERYGKT